MRIESYLDRIGVEATLEPSIETLHAIHRAHALSLTYENLDIQFGHPVTRRIDHIFDKIVRRGRGG